MKVPEIHRLINHPVLGSDSSYGCNGFFVIPHNKIDGYLFNCQVSDGMGWQHVSVTLTKEEMVIINRRRKQKRIKSVERCCTWEEMCFIKSLFWDEDETVIQYHPAKSEYVNCHKYCLHLWKPEMFEIPTPDSLMVGRNNEQESGEQTQNK